MGSFYTNVCVKKIDNEEIISFLRSYYRTAFITTTKDGWTIICDRETDNQNTELLSELAERLASKTGAVTFAVLNHDDDILWFQLFQGNDLVSEYATHGGPHSNVTALCRTFGKNAAVIKVWFILKLPLVFELWRHRLLAKELGLPLSSVGLGYNYISQEDIPEGLTLDDFIKVA